MKTHFYSRLLAFAALGATVAAAQATIIWNFSSVYTGADPGVSAPWFTLTIANGANAGDVNFTLANDLPTSGAGSTEFPSQLDLFSSINPKNISLNAGSQGVSGISDKATGPDHNLNLEVNFPLGTGALHPPEGASWTLHSNGLTENSFEGQNPAALLHIQGIPGGAEGTTSTWAQPAAVPEPASIAALAIGALAMLRKRRS